jgi:hypothetical protein
VFLGMCLQLAGGCSFFLNRLLNFMGVGCSLYGLAALYQYFSQDPIIKHTVKCRYCRKRINEKVSCRPGCYTVTGMLADPVRRLYGVSTARAGRMVGKIWRAEGRRSRGMPAEGHFMIPWSQSHGPSLHGSSSRSWNNQGPGTPLNRQRLANPQCCMAISMLISIRQMLSVLS